MLSKRDIRAQIVIIENSKYILLKHLHKKENYYFWGLPGGGVEAGESLEEAAIREAKEETGLEIELLPFKHEVEFSDEYNIYNRKVTFLGFPISGEAYRGYDPEPDFVNYFELVDIKWHDINDLDNIDDITIGDIIPVIDYVYNNSLIKRAGCLVFKKEENDVKYLVISRKANTDQYTLPKGHVEYNESYMDAAIRETQEEAGVNVKIIKELGFFFFERDNHFYQTYIYLSEYISTCESKENRIVKWLSYEEIMKLNMPRESKKFIQDNHLKL